MGTNSGRRVMASGTADKVVGTVKEAVGKLTGDKRIEAEGRTDQVKGDLKNATDNVTEAAKCPAARRPWRTRSRASPWGGCTDRTADDGRGWRDLGLASGARGRPPRVSGRPTRAGGGRCRPG